MAKPSPGSNRDRRAQVRYSHTLGASCRPLGQAEGSWPATIEDLSRTGAALEMAQEVRPGTVLVVALGGLGGRFARPLLMRVNNLRPGENGTWRVGGAFVPPLSEDDVQALLLARGR